MVVILDTDHLTVIQRRSEPAYSRLRARLTKLPHEAVQTTIVSFEEQMRGWLAVISHAQNQQKEVAAYQRAKVTGCWFGFGPEAEYAKVA